MNIDLAKTMTEEYQKHLLFSAMSGVTKVDTMEVVAVLGEILELFEPEKVEIRHDSWSGGGPCEAKI